MYFQPRRHATVLQLKGILMYFAPGFGGERSGLTKVWEDMNFIMVWALFFKGV